MKIKIIKGVQFYFSEGDIIDTYTDEYCKSLIKSGLAISLEPIEEMIIDTKKDDEENIVQESKPKQKQKKNK